MRWLLKNGSLRRYDCPGRRTDRRLPSRRQAIPMVEGFEDRLLLSGGNPAGTTLWSSSATPQNPAQADSSAVEVGVKFTSNVAGSITGIRFYKDSTNTGTHVGNLWTAGGTLLASATFGDETASGWQQVNFATPVAIQPDTVYVASYHTDVGHYADDTGYFNVGYDAAPLHAPADGASSPNGVYAYGASSTFPTQGWQASNCWVDVVFSPDLAVAPTVISVAPISGAADASTGTSVAATFSTAMNTATINAGAFVLLDPSGAQVPATVSYSTYTDTARLTPVASLAPATTYTAVLKGGPGGVEDSAGNPMAADYSWSFTTATPQPGPAPVVAITWPAAGAAGVDPRGVITATFNVEMDLKTITADTVQLLDPTGASVPIGVTYGGETATVTITPLGMGLTPGATYTTVIKGGDAGVKSLAGEPMAADYAWSFTTRTAFDVTDLGTLGRTFTTAVLINDRGQIAGTGSAAGYESAFLYGDSTMHILGTLGGTYSWARGINDRGQVVGYSGTAAGDQHAFLYGDGAMTDLGTLGGAYSWAFDINDLSQIVGYSGTAAGDQHAFLYGDGAMTDLGTLPGDKISSAVAINDRGQVVGASGPTPMTGHAFLYGDGAMIDLGTLGGAVGSWASGINDCSQVIGQSYTAAGELHAFLYGDGAMTDLGTLGGTTSYATAINDRGQVVGNSPTIAGVTHAFLYGDGAMTDLGTLGGTTSYATAINDRGQVVGSAEITPGSYIQHGFLYSNGAMTDLNSLVPADSLRGIAITDARAINEWGQIAANGYDSHGSAHALLLTPAGPGFTVTTADVPQA